MVNYVLNDKHELIGILIEIGGKEIPFTLKNNKIIRLDAPTSVRPRISREEYLSIYRQAAAILRKHEKQLAGTPEERLAQFAKQIERTPIDKKYLSKHEKERIWLLENNGIIYLSDGRIRMHRWEKTKDKLSKIPQTVEDLQAAIRMMDHILDNYKLTGGEIPTLRSTEAIIEDVLSKLQQWEEKGKKDIAEMNLLIARTVLKLEMCRNEFKKSVKEQLRASLGIMDKRGRVNPGAVSARLTAGLNRLSDRLNETRFILPVIALRKELLIFEEYQFEYISEQIRELIRSARDDFAGKSDKELDRDLGKILFLISRLWVDPYKKRAKPLKILITTAKSELRPGKRTQCQKLLNQIKLSA